MNKKSMTIDETFDLAYKNYQNNNGNLADNLCKNILKLNPNHFPSIFLLGVISVRNKDYDGAKKLFQKVIQVKPNYLPAYNNLGSVCKEIGEFKQAIYYYYKAIEIKPDYINAINNLSTLLSGINFTKMNKKGKVYSKESNLKELFLFLFKRNDVDHKDLFFNAKLFLIEEENFREISKIVNSSSSILKNLVILNLLEDELFLLILQKALIVDILLEKMLTKIRHEILLIFNSKKENLEKKLNFILSLAEQCFLNEYVFFQSNEEIRCIKKLIKSLENKKINELKIAILGCYVPLYSSNIISNKLINYKSKNILFNDLITMQVKEPLQEKKLTRTLKSFSKISDSISVKVRKQYEKNPYPRWRYNYKNLHSNFLHILNNQINPNNITINDKFKNPDVLVAGCGTGNHIFITEEYLNANILGVDLSLSSLAYAKRKKEEFGLKNVEFLHADILELKNLDRKFDVIECIGVLHHMKDPLAGLKILLDLLKPHGFLKLGLYSKMARQHIDKVRDLVKKGKFNNTITDIRNFRKTIINEKKNISTNKIFDRKDFYSTSSVRDLIFHVQEHHFTLPQLSKIFMKQKLEFLGFTDPIIKRKFFDFFSNKKNYTSLDDWHDFEKKNPDIFIGMYKFWLKKIDE